MRFHRYLVLLLAAPVGAAVAATWDLRDDFVSIAVADQQKTRNRDFEGTKLVFDGQYALRQVQGETEPERACCTLPSRPRHFYGLLEAMLQVGFDGDGLEYTLLGATPWAVLWEPDDPQPGRLRARRDVLEVGAVRWIKDDPLEVDSYLEVAIGRAGRIGEIKWSQSSSFTILLGVQAAIGWSWGESSDPVYSSVSNPFVGVYLDAALEHDRFGKLYADNRTIEGFSFSSPARGHPTVRESAVRFGYFKQFSRCISLNLYVEKRSFNFEEADLPGRYTKAGLFGAELGCHW